MEASPGEQAAVCNVWVCVQVKPVHPRAPKQPFLRIGSLQTCGYISCKADDEEALCISLNVSVPFPPPLSSEDKEVTAKDAAITPAKLSRGRAPKPLVSLGRRRGPKQPSPSTEENVSEEASNEQVSGCFFFFFNFTELLPVPF